MVDSPFLYATRVHPEAAYRTEMSCWWCFKRKDFGLTLDIDVADDHIVIFKVQ